MRGGRLGLRLRRRLGSLLAGRLLAGRGGATDRRGRGLRGRRRRGRAPLRVEPIRDLALHLEHRREGGDGGGALLDLRLEALDRRRVAVSAVALVAHEAPVRQLDDASLHAVDEAGLVRGHHDRRARRVDLREQLHDVGRRGGVEVSRRLIGQQQLRPVHERARDRHTLLLAARELVRHALGHALQADALERLGHGLLHHGARGADHLQRERHVLEHALGRQQAEVLEDRPDVPAEVGRAPVGERLRVAPQHDDAARGRHPLPQDEAQARGLPRSRLADEEHELTALDLERDIVEGG
ncbi:hypothetical protein GCM10027064_11850 [Microbacterium petrolearium]